MLVQGSIVNYQVVRVIISFIYIHLTKASFTPMHARQINSYFPLSAFLSVIPAVRLMFHAQLAQLPRRSGNRSNENPSLLSRLC